MSTTTLKSNCSLVLVLPKPKFLELVKASDRRRFGHEYNFPGDEENMVWAIPNIDELGSREGSYSYYLERLKVPILKYELEAFEIGPEELTTELSASLCDELLELRVYARVFPIEKLLRAES